MYILYDTIYYSGFPACDANRSRGRKREEEKETAQGDAGVKTFKGIRDAFEYDYWVYLVHAQYMNVCVVHRK